MLPIEFEKCIFYIRSSIYKQKMSKYNNLLLLIYVVDAYIFVVFAHSSSCSVAQKKFIMLKTNESSSASTQTTKKTSNWLTRTSNDKCAFALICDHITQICWKRVNAEESRENKNVLYGAQRVHNTYYWKKLPRNWN